MPMWRSSVMVSESFPSFLSHLDLKKQCGQLFVVQRAGVRKHGKFIQIVVSVTKKSLMTKGRLFTLRKRAISLLCLL